jgi:hypothetical protein
MIQRDDMISNGSTTFRADGSAQDTALVVTDEQIRKLRYEAGLAQDWKQVDLCNRALDGNKADRESCARAIQAAQAMADD